MKKEIQKWLVDWFSKNSSTNEEEVLSHIDDNYFELGYVDSFGFLSMIVDIQEKYEVELNNDDFTGQGFITINGLSELIANKIS